MICKFVVGQQVVCVEAQDDPEPPNPVFGQVYTVSWVGVCEGHTQIDLAELPMPETDDFYRGYQAKAFRPVVERKTDISLFKAMLSPSKQTVEA